MPPIRASSARAAPSTTPSARSTATLGGEGDAWLGTNPTPQRINEAIRDYGIRHEYDTLGRTIRSVDANGNTDAVLLRPREPADPYGQRHRPSANNTLAGEVSETTYNSFGQTAVGPPLRRAARRCGHGPVAGERRRRHSPTRSLLGKLAALADASLDQVSLYEYDRCGRLVKQVDGENGVTENIYNAHGELAAQVRSTREGQTTTKQFDYDLNGRVVSQTDDVGGINANTRTDVRRVRSRDSIHRRCGTGRPRRPTRTAAAASS